MNWAVKRMDSQEALVAVEEQIRITKDRRMFERLQAVRLRLKGKSILEIAEIIGRSDKTVRTYWSTYLEKGLSGLTMCFSPGPNQRLTEKQREELKKIIIESVPADVGI